MEPFDKAVPINGPTPEQIAAKYNLDLERARKIVARSRSKELFINDRYQVALFDGGELGGKELVHLSIKRIDREPIHDWRDLQEIKNMLVGPENEAMEVYPAESRLVDTSNQFHLWAFKDATVRLPFGFNERLVDEDPIANAKQRPFNQQALNYSDLAAEVTALKGLLKDQESKFMQLVQLCREQGVEVTVFECDINEGA